MVKANNMSSIIIEINDRAQKEPIIRAIKKMKLKAKVGRTHIEVFSEDLMDFYYLGANVVGEANGLFKGPLTT